MNDDKINNLTVKKTTDAGLCSSCGICQRVCPQKAISLVSIGGQFVPKVDPEKCNGCTLCLKLCTGIDIDPHGLRNEKITDNIFDGRSLGCYAAAAKDRNLAINSTSGGVITTLVSALLRHQVYDGAFVLSFDKFEGKPAEVQLVEDADAVPKSAKSKYIAASVGQVVERLRRREKEKKYIIVGTACQFSGLKKIISLYNLPGDNYLFLGIFCDKTLNFNILRYFEETYQVGEERVSSFFFRSKNRDGWPGNTEIKFDSGREIMVGRKIRMQLKDFFQLERCLYCVDKLNREADIVCGDCYVKGQESYYGKSSVIIRTEKGEKIFDKYRELFYLDEISIEQIKASQLMKIKYRNLEHIKVLLNKNKLYPNLNFPSAYLVSSQAEKRLTKLISNLRLGQAYQLASIRRAIISLKLKLKLKFIITTLWSLAVVVIIASFESWRKKNQSKFTLKDNDLILLGVEYSNRGSQAMAFTVMDGARKIWPDKIMHQLSTPDYERSAKEKKHYKLNFLPWDIKIKARLLNPLAKLAYPNSDCRAEEEKLKQILENGGVFMDISGFALSSKHKLFASLNYLLNIALAKKYSLPFYILPQSLGPFNYSWKYKYILKPLIRKYLSDPEKIYVREKECLNHLDRLGLANAEWRHDIVLGHEALDVNNVFSSAEIGQPAPDVPPNSVGLIPNARVFERTDSAKLYETYRQIIGSLTRAGKKVYLFHYSDEDRYYCERIAHEHLANPNVQVIADYMNAVAIENTIKRMDFVITSRYHSIIHALKNNVPVLVIGWADKYQALLEDFGQLDYFFDCQNKLDIESIGQKLRALLKEYSAEKGKIATIMQNIKNREGNIFDLLIRKQ